MVNQQFATAVHVLTALGCFPNQLLSSEMLAASVKTNPVVIRRLLAQLIKAKLVVSTRGKSGGVSLAKDPSKITLKDIYLAVSPPEAISPRDKTPFKKCPVSCAMYDIMADISNGTQKATLTYLESKKISDLTKKIELN